MAKTVSITNARKNIYQITHDVCEMHEEVVVYNASTEKNVVIISEEDWNAIKETLYLHSVPGLVDSILEASNEKDEECTKYVPGEKW